MRSLCACGVSADCELPFAMCRSHAIVFYQTIVRIGAGLAELQRTVPDMPIRWLPLPVAVPMPVLHGVAFASHVRPRPKCRVALCDEPRHRKWGKLCQGHLRAARFSAAMIAAEHKRAARAAKMAAA